MPYPSEINDHVEQALAQLIDLFKGKPNIEAMFRCKAARMVLVTEVVSSAQYRMKVNDTPVYYFSTSSATEKTIREGLMNAVRNGVTGVTVFPSAVSDDIFYIRSDIPGNEIAVEI